MMAFGVDYAWHGDLGPFIRALKANGVTFVCRYLSHSSGKNLTRAEAEALTAAGISIVVVWETTADRALAGRSAGVQDARDALAQAKACGMPSGRPIFFAVDFDTVRSQLPTVLDYLSGTASVLGHDLVGPYGEHDLCKAAFDAGFKWAWQTYAWSAGKWEPRAQLQQYSNDHTIGGVGLDYDRSMHSDFGQWRIGWTPTPAPTPQETDVNLSDSIPLTVKDSTGKQVRTMAGDIIGRDEVAVWYALGNACASTFALQGTVIPLLKAQQETIQALAANASGVDVQPILDAIKAKIDAIEISVNVTDPAAS